MAATSENPHIWFKSISLENVRSFGENQTINFTDKEGNAARWNIILGDNGTGKTTILKALLVMVQSQQTIMETGADLTELWRFNKEDDGCLIEGEISDSSQPIHTGFFIKKMVKGSKGNASIFQFTRKEELYVNIFAYRADRKISTSDISEKKQNPITSFFQEKDELTNAEKWLIQADYLSYKNEEFVDRNTLVSKILLKLLRDEVSNIYINTDTGVPKVFFKTHYGDVRLHELSLGYKTLIAWMVDFARGLLDKYPDSKDPLSEPAVCLVDEIDLHLHPKFQRTIIKFLTDTFPNTQFIVTAHSPLIVVAAEERPLDANIILLKREGDQTVVVNDPVDVSKWSVDQILNSDLFGHVPARSQPVTELQTERDTLLSKLKLTKKEQVRLSELDEKIGFVPSGKGQTEIQAETIIQQLADVLRKQKAK